MQTFTNVLVPILGILLIVAAFLAKGIRGGIFCSGPLVPITKTGRVILFIGGVLVFIVGIKKLLA